MDSVPWICVLYQLILTKEKCCIAQLHTILNMYVYGGNCVFDFDKGPTYCFIRYRGHQTSLTGGGGDMHAPKCAAI